MTVGFRARLVVLIVLAADVAVRSAAAGTRVDLGLTSGNAAFLMPFVLGEEKASRAVVAPCVFKDVRLVSFGGFADFFACSGETIFLADSMTTTGFAAEPCVTDFSVLGETDVRGAFRVVGDFGKAFAGGACLVGGGLIGFASLVVISLAAGGG